MLHFLCSLDILLARQEAGHRPVDNAKACLQASLRVDFFRCLSSLLCCICIDHAHGDFWMHLLRDSYRYLEGSERANWIRHFNSAAVKVDALAFTQASSDILAGDRAIEAPLAANPGLEGERHLGQALGLLPIQIGLFLNLALFRGYTLLAVRHEGGSCSGRQLTRQEIVAGIAVGHFF